MSAKELIDEAYDRLDKKLSSLNDSWYYLSPSSRETDYGQDLENHIDCITDAMHHLNKALDLIREDD